MRSTSRRRGATLIEIVVAVMILGIAGSAFLAMLVHSLRGWSSGTGLDTAGNQATMALQKLSNEIRDARMAVASEDKETLTVTFPRKVTDPTTHEETYDLSLNDPVDRTYYVSEGNLVRNVGGQVTIVGRGVTSVEFGADGGIVRVTNLTSTEQVGTKTSTQVVTGYIYLRNYRS